MIAVAEADNWLKRLLSEDYDVDTAFPQIVRISALQEAVIEYASVRPDLYSERVELEYDDPTGAYLLPNDYEWLLQIHGLESEGKLYALDVMSYGATSEKLDDCWPHQAGSPGILAWSNSDARRVYSSGEHDPAKNQKVIATAFRVVQPVDGNAVGNLNAPRSAFPRIIDYAMSRCYARETAAGGSQLRHLEVFKRGIQEELRTDSYLNPVASARYGIQR